MVGIDIARSNGDASAALSAMKRNPLGDCRGALDMELRQRRAGFLYGIGADVLLVVNEFSQNDATDA